MDFQNDIGALVPVIAKVIEESAYNPVSNVVGFRLGDLRVVIEKKHMYVYGTDSEEVIKELVEMLISRITENPDKDN